MLPRDLWWSLVFYTDENPLENHEHKPMRAEVHYTIPLPKVNVDFGLYYDNYGYDPVFPYPVSIAISSYAEAYRQNN